MHHRLSRAARAALVVAAASVAACSRSFDVPMPVLGPTATANVPPAERATIVLPVSISMSTLRAHIDSIFPATDSLDRAKCSALGGLICHQYVYRRDTLDIKMIGERLTLFTRLRARARVALPGVGGIASCGYAPEEMRRAEMRFATNLYWRTDWRLASRATVVAPSILDPCQVTALRLDATPLMRTIIDAQLSHVRQQVDSIVPALADLKPAADSLWRTMLRPFPVDSQSTVWFSMVPEGVSLAALGGTGPAITTALVLTARPRVTIGAKPAPDSRPLPSLTLAGSQTGIHLPLEIEVPFDDLSKRVTALMSGEVAGKGITVGTISVWGVGDTAVVKVGIEGKLSGSVYLLGRVGYDAQARAVLIHDLKYTLESDNRMSSIKATLGAPLIRHALNEATGHGRLAIGAQLDQVTNQLGDELNRVLAPGVYLSGGVTNVRIDRLFATQKAFVLRVVFDGDARVDVR